MSLCVIAELTCSVVLILVADSFSMTAAVSGVHSKRFYIAQVSIKKIRTRGQHKHE